MMTSIMARASARSDAGRGLIQISASAASGVGAGSITTSVEPRSLAARMRVPSGAEVAVRLAPQATTVRGGWSMSGCDMNP